VIVTDAQDVQFSGNTVDVAAEDSREAVSVSTPEQATVRCQGNLVRGGGSPSISISQNQGTAQTVIIGNMTTNQIQVDGQTVPPAPLNVIGI
jgi:hypothetical protein